MDAFVSDAIRRPVQPRSGWVVFDADVRAPLGWDGHHLTGADARPQARVTDTTVVLADGSELRVSFDWRGEEPFRQQAKPPGEPRAPWAGE